MVTLGKLEGDRYIQGDHYMQVKFAENIRQLKIFGKFVGDRIIQGDRYIQGRYTSLAVLRCTFMLFKDSLSQSLLKQL